MKKRTTNRVRSWVPGLIAAGLIAGSASGAPAEQVKSPGKKAQPQGQSQRTASGKPGAEAEILRRLQELEAQVAQFKAETARLQAELLRRDAKGAPAIAPTPTIGKAAVGGGEWDEPEVDKKAEGRDEEARRRLLALETQARKSQAETAKQEEAQKDKVRFDFSGKYKGQVNSRHNFNLNNSLQEWVYDNTTFFDQRYSLQVDATYEALLTRLVLDKGNLTFDWKEGSEGTLERWGQFQTLNSPLVRELFVQYTGPFMIRAGRQNWDVGNKIVLEGPMDAIRLQYPLGHLPWGQTTLSGGYMAVAGGWSSYTNFNATGGPLGGDRSALLNARNKLDAYYLDLDVRPSRSLRVKPYLLKVVDRGGAGDADLNLDKDFDAATMPRDGGFQPLWTGIAASADFQNWKFEAEAILLSGDYTADRKLKANALLLKATRDLGRVGSLANLSAGLEFGRGSGNGTDSTASGTMQNFNGLFLCKERNKFGNIYSEDIRAGYNFWDSNLSNITYVRLDTILEPRKGLKITPSLTKLWTTKAVFEGRGPILDWSRGAATSTGTTRDVGWEADLNVTYPLYTHVDGFASIGYFRPGAVYALPSGSAPKPAYELVLGGEVKF